MTELHAWMTVIETATDEDTIPPEMLRQRTKRVRSIIAQPDHAVAAVRGLRDLPVYADDLTELRRPVIRAAERLQKHLPVPVFRHDAAGILR